MNNAGLVITPDKYFYAQNGSVIKSVEELFEALQDMPYHTFKSHVTDDKNDFYNWIRDVFGNHNLAINLKKCKERDEMLKHVFVSLFM